MIDGVKQGDFVESISEIFQINFGEALVNSAVVPKQFIILDNSPCHRLVENRLAESIPVNTELIRLEPYSCKLNPIVFCFNSIKAYIKGTFSEHGPIRAT